MIIGISGKIGSGKDTIANIINYFLWIQYMSPEIIDFPKFGELQKGVPYSPNQFIIKKFAGKLKQIVVLLTGCKVEDLEKEEFKNQLLPNAWQVWNIKQEGLGHKLILNKLSFNTEKEVSDFCKNTTSSYGNCSYTRSNRTYRWLLQDLGTRGLRECHENVHINALFADYSDTGRFINEEATSSNGGYYNKQVWQENLPNWVITDVRFPNEVEAIESRSGFIIRVNRELIDVNINSEKVNKGTAIITLHPSETALDNHEFKYRINNNSSIEELVKNVKTVLEIEGIL